MASLHLGITGRADLEPLAVSPRQACALLNVGPTRLYELLGSGELESYLDGHSRRITMRSIRRRIKRLLKLKASGAKPAGRRPPPPPRKARIEAELDVGK